MAGNSEKNSKTWRKPFEKGKSGNPSGRPKMDKDSKAMLKSAAPEAVKLMVDTLKDSSVKIETRVRCAENILDRVYGKANQPIDFGGELPNIEIVLGNGKEYAK